MRPLFLRREARTRGTLLPMIQTLSKQWRQLDLLSCAQKVSRRFQTIPQPCDADDALDITITGNCSCVH